MEKEAQMAVDPRAQAAARFVEYELAMVRDTAEMLRTVPISDANRVTRNVALESLLIHARSLADFFLGDRPPGRRDDILAIDYFDNATTWTQQRARLMPYISVERDRLNRAVAHLSYDRIQHKAAGADPSWDISRIVNDVEGGWQAFVRAIDAVHRAWFPSFAAAARPATMFAGMQAKTCS
jgi:hypothetical protein